MINNIRSYEVVGEVNRKLAEAAKFNYKGKIYMSPGVKKHIVKRHKKDLKREFLDDIPKYIRLVISEPDYVGKHPDKIGYSMEFVKKIGRNLLVAIEVDLDDNYIYVASLYPITESKVVSRVNSGRFKKIKN